MAPTIQATRADLERRRVRILERLGMTLEEFAARVETSTLSGEEWEARDRLEEIYFLLDEEPAWSSD